MKSKGCDSPLMIHSRCEMYSLVMPW